MREIYLIAMIFALMYTGLALSFEYKEDKFYKEWEKKHTQNSKKN